MCPYTSLAYHYHLMHQVQNTRIATFTMQDSLMITTNFTLTMARAKKEFNRSHTISGSSIASQTVLRMMSLMLFMVKSRAHASWMRSIYFLHSWVTLVLHLITEHLQMVESACGMNRSIREELSHSTMLTVSTPLVRQMPHVPQKLSLLSPHRVKLHELKPRVAQEHNWSLTTLCHLW